MMTVVCAVCMMVFTAQAQQKENGNNKNAKSVAPQETKVNMKTEKAVEVPMRGTAPVQTSTITEPVVAPVEIATPAKVEATPVTETRMEAVTETNTNAGSKLKGTKAKSSNRGKK